MMLLVSFMAMVTVVGCTTAELEFQTAPPAYPQPSPAMNAAIAQAFSGVASVAHVGGYNDVQRLQRNGNAGDYGPLASLYVAPKAYVEADYEDPNAALVAFVEVAGDPGNTTSPAAYNALNLDRADTARIYCVYLTFKQAGPNKNWDGYVEPITTTGCPGPGNGKLKADEMVDSDYPLQTDYIYAARWVDTQNDMPTLGVTCAAAFCTIGRGNADTGRGNGNSGTKEIDLKPWHDDQRLALPGSPMNRDVRATVAPVKDLGNIKKADFASGAKAATITLEADPVAGSKYALRGFHKGDNDIYVKMVNDATNEWAAEIVKGGTAPTNTWPLKVYRTDHSQDGITVPGAARWIWHPNDEDVWLGCDQGCCIISQDPSKGRGSGGGRAGAPPGKPDTGKGRG